MDGDNNEVANKRSEEYMALSEEVNGTPQRNTQQHNNDDEEIGTPAAQEQEEDDNDSEDEDEEDGVHPGEVSIGRKLWTFIST